MTIEQKILQYNYWEHFKASKDLARILPVNHPRRIELDKEMNVILQKLKIKKT